MRAHGRRVVSRADKTRRVNPVPAQRLSMAQSPYAAGRLGGHVRDRLRPPDMNVQPFGEMRQWRYVRESEAEAVCHCVRSDVGLCRLQWPGGIVNFRTAKATSSIHRVQAVALGEPGIQRSGVARMTLPMGPYSVRNSAEAAPGWRRLEYTMCPCWRLTEKVA